MMRHPVAARPAHSGRATPRMEYIEHEIDHVTAVGIMIDKVANRKEQDDCTNCDLPPRECEYRGHRSARHGDQDYYIGKVKYTAPCRMADPNQT